MKYKNIIFVVLIDLFNFYAPQIWDFYAPEIETFDKYPYT